MPYANERPHSATSLPARAERGENLEEKSSSSAKCNTARLRIDDCRVPLCTRCGLRPGLHDVLIPGELFYQHVCTLCLRASERLPEGQKGG